jgi:hypothetical protein
LSLNAIACPEGVPSEMDRAQVAGALVQYLPCHVWNYSLEMDKPHTYGELNSKAVLHLKGDRKRMVEQIIEYQERR